MNKSSIIGKISVKGDLILKSPLLIGDGAGETADNFRDVHVLKNRQGKPFIPGTSLCGVLREWLENIAPDSVKEIFGDNDDKDGMQSSIQLDDIALADYEVISRDGVRIDGITGAGVDGGKYDFEVVERGAKGSLKLLINLRGCHSLDKISNVVGRLLQKLQDGIRLGAMTSKGFGLTGVENLTADLYDFRDKKDVVAWLTDKTPAKKILPCADKISANENDFVVDAEFIFNSSFIIRDYDATEKLKETTVTAATLKSRNDFVIPGTSLKGILRHRAEYIFDRLGLDKNLLENLMGNSTPDKKIKSRFIVAESYVSPKDFSEVVHTRNKIDRFTGGTLQGTLFTTKPAYQKNFDAPTLKIHFEIKDAKDFEAGLALFLLRDLWLGNVAVGGEKSVGRGTVRGQSAEINFKGKTFTLDMNGKVVDGDAAELENLSSALKNFSGGDGK